MQRRSLSTVLTIALHTIVAIFFRSRHVPAGEALANKRRWMLPFVCPSTYVAIRPIVPLALMHTPIHAS